MDGKIILTVVGIRGVGKTALCRALQERSMDIMHVSIGDCVEEYRRTNGISSYPDMVRDVRREIAMARKATLLLDSGDYIPATSSVLFCPSFNVWEALRPRGIIAVVAESSLISSRRRLDAKERSNRSEEDSAIDLHQQVLLGGALVHAASRKIPCSVVLNNGSIEQGATAISEAIRLSIAEAEMRVRLEQGGLL